MQTDDAGAHTKMPDTGMRRIILIRHAEKPHGDVRGITPSGRKSAKSLTPRGWQRAGALVQLFRPQPDGCLRPGLATPVAVFASRVEAHEESRRPRRTVKPTAAFLGLRVDHRFGHDGEQELAEAVRDVAGPVLVCWHHEGIPKLTTLMAPGLVTPPSWPSDRFDVVWVLDRDEADGPWRLTQVPQLLLAGDLDTTI